MNPEKIGKYIAKLRQAKSLTQQQLADQLFISDKAVSKWERGINLPDVSLLEKLALILDTSVNELLSGETKKTARKNRLSQKTILLIIALTVLTGGYLNLKLFYLNVVYNIADASAQSLSSKMARWGAGGGATTYQIKRNALPANMEYLEFGDIKIGNYFKELTKVTQPDAQQSHPQTDQWIIYSHPDDYNISFTMMIIDEPYPFMSDFLQGEVNTANRIDKHKYQKVNRKKILKTKKVSNDWQFFELLRKYSYQQANLFTSIKEMKTIYALNYYTLFVHEPFYFYTDFLTGDYAGYLRVLFNGKSVTLSIIKNNKLYYFEFTDYNPNTDYASGYFKDYQEIIKTIVID